MRGILWCAALLCAASGAASGAESGAGPQCARDQPCTALGSWRDEHDFTIRDTELTIKYNSEERQFIVKCGNVTLDDPALPALPRRAPVARVRFEKCAPPRHGYARVLDALNVSLADAPNATLELISLPADPPLRAAHLDALRLSALTVKQPWYITSVTLPLDPALLGALPALRELRLEQVSLPAGALLDLPRGLRVLELERVAGAALDAAALARLPELDRLFVDDRALQELDLSATPLRDVTVEGPLTLTLGARVEALTLLGAVRAELRGECAALRRVRLENVTRPLPARWLARCGGVRELRVDNSPGALGGAELEGASALRVLEARSCELRELPPRWLADAGQLRKLDLSHNQLTRLPSLAASPLLEELRVQYNQLHAAALDELGELGARGALDALRVLRLVSNPLGDLCDNTDINDAVSPLAGLWGLRKLDLTLTGQTALCRDWRLQLLGLEELDLRNNPITRLTLADLQWRRDVPAEVDLRYNYNNPVRVHYTRDDYRAALQLRPDPQAPLTTLLLNSVLQCGCRDYWFARAWRERPGHARVELRGLRCRREDGTERELLDVPLDELCDKPENDTSLASQDIKEKKDDDFYNFVKYRNL